MDWISSYGGAYVVLLAVAFLAAAIGVAAWTVRWLRRPVTTFSASEPERDRPGTTEEHRFELEDVNDQPRA